MQINFSKWLNEAEEVLDLNGIKFYKNPSHSDLNKIDPENQHLRGIMDDGDIYIWPEKVMYHREAATLLNLQWKKKDPTMVDFYLAHKGQEFEAKLQGNMVMVATIYHRNFVEEISKEEFDKKYEVNRYYELGQNYWVYCILKEKNWTLLISGYQTDHSQKSGKAALAANHNFQVMMGENNSKASSNMVKNLHNPEYVKSLQRQNKIWKGSQELQKSADQDYYRSKPEEAGWRRNAGRTAQQYASFADWRKRRGNLI